MKPLPDEYEAVESTPPWDVNHRIEDVLATLGHELRNPLCALSHVLEIWPSAKQDPVQMEQLRSIMQRQVRQLTCLSEDLLDSAGSMQGKFTLRREHVPLGQLIDGACEEVRPFINRCGHALTVQLPTEPIAVYGDPSRLLQVFANLLQNAAKFTNQNGSLCVAVESQDGMAAVRVRDNGPGIEEHRLPAIFDPMTPVNGEHRPANAGLGIGLRLVRTFVELHGGSVAVHSAGPGQGSEFTVLLPLSDDAAPVRQPAPRQPVVGPDGHGHQPPMHRIVVVDDDRSMRELLARLLRMIGQSVTVASHGEMAVRMVLELRPQVVFLDLMMHGMGGCEVARQLRSHPELAGLVLIALSGNADEASRRQADEAGFDRYLVKPAGLSELVEALNGIPAAVRPCRS